MIIEQRLTEHGTNIRVTKIGIVNDITLLLQNENGKVFGVLTTQLTNVVVQYIFTLGCRNKNSKKGM